MKKFLVAALISILAMFSLMACSKDTAGDVDVIDEIVEDDGVVEEEGESIEDEGSELTYFANGGVIWDDIEDSYDYEISASYMELGATFGDVIGAEFKTIEKDGAEFAGWTIYAVSKGEWVQEEVTDLADGQACIPCGSYGYYFMEEYEIISESATTEELRSMVNDGRNYYALVNWK